MKLPELPPLDMIFVIVAGALFALAFLGVAFISACQLFHWFGL